MKTEQSNFNPRTPYGMRLFCRFSRCQYDVFQSTHPLRDATPACSKGTLSQSDFNPRTPYGMRLYIYCIVLNLVIFQSTHPLRDATLLDSSSTTSQFSNFNPRTPYGMRRSVALYFLMSVWISIHAPLTGCDIMFGAQMVAVYVFQSTHPLRDATL